MDHEPSIDRAVVGARITEVRKLRGLTMDALGALFDPPWVKQQVYRLEKGDAGINYEFLVEIARALRVSYDYLLTGRGEPVVVISPLRVVQSKGYPVEIVSERRTAEAEKRYFHVPFETIPGDGAWEVMDESMEPEFREGDIVIFRKLRPIPNKFVVARDNDTGAMMLRKYRVSRKPGIPYTLMALNGDAGLSINGGDHIEIMGLVIYKGRMYASL